MMSLIGHPLLLHCGPLPTGTGRLLRIGELGNPDTGELEEGCRVRRPRAEGWHADQMKRSMLTGFTIFLRVLRSRSRFA